MKKCHPKRFTLAKVNRFGLDKSNFQLKTMAI